jgi:quercetin dioxygenase-like cupin family protein
MEKQERNTMAALFYPSWTEKIVYSDDGPQPQILLETERSRTLVAGLKSGQQIPVHPEGLATYYFLEGNGWMTVDEEDLPVSPGAIVITPADARRGMRAETRLAFLAVRVA